MNYCKDTIFNYWSCCPSINLSNYVTEEELEEKISGITGGCDCDAITRQIEALQGAIVSLGDRITILENKMAQKADLSALTPIWDAIYELSGDTPTPPTPDTGETTDKKLTITLTGGTTVEVECDGDDYLTEAQVKGEFIEYMQYETVEVGNCITEIGNKAFWACFNVTAITLPDTITDIHNHAFNTNAVDMPVKHLDVTINATTPPTLNQDGESGGYFFSQDFTIYVPSGSVDAYKAAWPQYANMIYAINNGTGGGDAPSE